MNKINAIIIDDEPACSELLSLMLGKYHPEINVLARAGSMKSGLREIQKHENDLDLLFLDIQMQGGDGFSLLQELEVPRFKIIFVTAFDQFAIRAFKFSALDYLLKPVDKDELAEAIGKFRAGNSAGALELESLRTGLKQQKSFEKLAVATQTEIRFIALARISFMESDNNYTSIYLDDGTRLVASRNIGHYEDLLEDSGFLRVSNTNIVNLKKVLRFIKSKSGTLELENGQLIQVSSAKKEKLLRMLELS
jgi:two-component system LytT family response regulator